MAQPKVAGYIAFWFAPVWQRMVPIRLAKAEPAVAVGLLDSLFLQRPPSPVEQDPLKRIDLPRAQPEGEDHWK